MMKLVLSTDKSTSTILHVLGFKSDILFARLCPSVEPRQFHYDSNPIYLSY